MHYKCQIRVNSIEIVSVDIVIVLSNNTVASARLSRKNAADTTLRCL